MCTDFLIPNSKPRPVFTSIVCSFFTIFPIILKNGPLVVISGNTQCVNDILLVFVYNSSIVISLFLIITTALYSLFRDIYSGRPPPHPLRGGKLFRVSWLLQDFGCEILIHIYIDAAATHQTVCQTRISGKN